MQILKEATDTHEEIYDWIVGSLLCHAGLREIPNYDVYVDLQIHDPGHIAIESTSKFTLHFFVMVPGNQPFLSLDRSQAERLSCPSGSLVITWNLVSLFFTSQPLIAPSIKYYHNCARIFLAKGSSSLVSQS